MRSFCLLLVVLFLSGLATLGLAQPRGQVCGTLLGPSKTLPNAWVLRVASDQTVQVRDVLRVTLPKGTTCEVMVYSVQTQRHEVTVIAMGADDPPLRAGLVATLVRHAHSPGEPTRYPTEDEGELKPRMSYIYPCLICGGNTEPGIAMPRMGYAICNRCRDLPVVDQEHTELAVYPAVVHFTCSELDLSSTTSEPNLDLVTFRDASLQGVWSSEQIGLNGPGQSLVRLRIRLGLKPLDLIGVIVHEWAHAWHNRNDPRFFDKEQDYREGLATYIACLFYKHAGLGAYFWQSVYPTLPETPYQSGLSNFLKGNHRCSLIKEKAWP